MDQKIRLFSKNNKVERFLSGNQKWIRKTYTNPESMSCELNVLQRLKETNCFVPLVLGVAEDYIDLEDLGDQTLLRWYEEMETAGSVQYKEMVVKLVHWLLSYYVGMSGYLAEPVWRSDMNFRNFIIKDNQIYGVDFEEIEQGSLEGDAGFLMAFGLLYDPMMTEWKKDFSDCLLEVLADETKLPKDILLHSREQALQSLMERRKRDKKGV